MVVVKDCICPRCKRKESRFWEYNEDYDSSWDGEIFTIRYTIYCKKCGYEYEYRQYYKLDSAENVVTECDYDYMAD